MTLLFSIFVICLGLFVGMLIGIIGVGGVILVPVLSYVGGVPIKAAIAAAMMGYLLTGLLGTAIYMRQGSIRWSMATWLCLGAMPAAFVGAWTTNTVASSFLESLIALLTISVGLRSLVGQAEGAGGQTDLSKLSLLLIGGMTGFGSAITGTGGPLILVPTMVWLKVPILTAIGLSQVIQFPIATLATIGNIIYAEPDFVLGACVGVGLAAGATVGATIAHRLPTEFLRRLVSIMLIGVGTAMIAKILFG
ncbi:MAG: sulfite exporter TauE/SafE family protein [Methyloligellaceae bacterium]